MMIFLNQREKSDLKDLQQLIWERMKQMIWNGKCLQTIENVNNWIRNLMPKARKRFGFQKEMMTR